MVDTFDRPVMTLADPAGSLGKQARNAMRNAIFACIGFVILLPFTMCLGCGDGPVPAQPEIHLSGGCP